MEMRVNTFDGKEVMSFRTNRRSYSLWIF